MGVEQAPILAAMDVEQTVTINGYVFYVVVTTDRRR